MSRPVPASLRRWFVVHFAADVLAAVPLLVAPRAMLELLGWTTVDPIATRLVAAALFGIGLASLIGRGAAAETFRAMLDLKIIWSGAAVIGIVWSLVEGAPPAAWAILAIFAGFHLIWVRYRVLLRPS